MRDVDFPYRQAIYTALNGAITYEGNVIPVYSGYVEATGPLFIDIVNCQVRPDHNKHKFQQVATLTIEIVDYQTRGTSYKAVNAIYDSMMQILTPSPLTAGFTITGFQALNVEANTNDLLEQTLDKVVRKIVSLQTIIIQTQIF